MISMSRRGLVLLLLVAAYAALPPLAFAVNDDKTSGDDASKENKFPLWAVEEQMIEYTNKVRAEHGLPPIKMDERLVNSARQHAWWMVRNNTLQHTSAQVAENIAMGQRTASEVVRDWMNSPGHRANMLGNYSRIGAAAYQTKGGTCYWCLQFLR